MRLSVTTVATAILKHARGLGRHEPRILPQP